MRKINTSIRLQYVTWGGLDYQNGSLSNLVTFFRYDLKE